MEQLKLAGEVIKHARRLSLTPVVDDDFPEVKHYFDSAVCAYAEACAMIPAAAPPGWALLIVSELKRARGKFPRWTADTVKAAAIVAEESGELIRAALQHCDEGGSMEACDAEAIQTAAMCVRFLERK